MSYENIEFRTVTRTAYCRGCDKELLPNTEKVLATFSFRNRGQHIYICQDCIDKFNRLRLEG